MRYDLYNDNNELVVSFYDAMEADFYAADNGITDVRLVNSCKNCHEHKNDVQERTDCHGIFTGYYCNDCYENNYPYRKDDYTNGTGIADDGTPLDY